MTYGTMSEVTREYILKRAAEANILERIEASLEPDFSHETGLTDEGHTVYEVSVIYSGALDETFYITGPYEINVVDWVAESVNEEWQADPDHELGWSILLTEYAYEDAGSQRYKVTDETFGG